MTTAFDTQVQTMPAATLAPIVQQALNRSTVKLTQWTVEPFRGNCGGKPIFITLNWLGTSPVYVRPCYSVMEQVDATGSVAYWLWLEDLTMEADTHWSLEDYQRC